MNNFCFKKNIWLLYFGKILLCSAQIAFAKHDKIELFADSLHYDKPLDTFKAIKNVVMRSQQDVLKSDFLKYNRLSHLIEVKGNVEFHKSTGEIVYAQSGSLNDTFQSGKFDKLKLILNDQSILNAQQAVLKDKDSFIFTQANYTSCQICEKMPIPFWHIKAKKIDYNKELNEVIYHEAYFHIKNKPVFYLPYFSHYLKRKSGFLTPSISLASDPGPYISIPYYWVISDNKEFKFIPYIYSKKFFVLSGEYKQRFYDGQLEIKGSMKPFKNDENKNIRWYLASKARFEINDKNLLQFDLARASDTTYYRRFHKNESDSLLPVLQSKNLISFIKFEHFDNTYYWRAQALGFQTQISNATPLAAPHLYFHYISPANSIGGFWEIHGNYLSLFRSKQVNHPLFKNYGSKQVHRVNLQSQYNLPYITNTGHCFDLSLKLKHDTYLVKKFVGSFQNNQSTTNEDFHHAMRLFGQSSLNWRYPIIKTFANNLNKSRYNLILEPKVSVILSPNLNESEIPNEDSFTPELDRSNLFLAQRFSGWDRVDHGSRFIYGFSTTLRTPQKNQIELFLGQSLRLDNKKIWPDKTFETNKASPYVLGVLFDVANKFHFNHQTTIDHSNFNFLSSKNSIRASLKNYSLELGYIYLAKQASFWKAPISQINWVAQTDNFNNWKVSFSQGINLTKKHRGTLYNSISLEWKNDCFKISTGIFHNSYKDRDIKPNIGLLFKCDFKNLGSTSLPVNF